MCELIYLLRFGDNPKAIVMALPQSSWTYTEHRKVWGTWLASSQLRPNKVTLPSCFGSHTVTKSLFHSLFGAMLFCIFVLFCCCWFHCLKWSPSIGQKGCLVFPSERKLWCTLWRNCGLGKFHSGTSYSAVGCELNVNELTMSIK